MTRKLLVAVVVVLGGFPAALAFSNTGGPVLGTGCPLNDEGDYSGVCVQTRHVGVTHTKTVRVPHVKTVISTRTALATVTVPGGTTTVPGTTSTSTTTVPGATTTNTSVVTENTTQTNTTTVTVTTTTTTFPLG